MCKLCERFWKRVWQDSDAWEIAHSNDAEMRLKESENNRATLDAAAAMSGTDPAALQLYLQAAEAGSVFGMERVGWQYWTGTGTSRDLAKAAEYYLRAIEGGSWMATIYHARLLDQLGQFDSCDEVLNDGIAAGFVPAFFWLAWLRYKRSKTWQTCREVRPLLEYAAKAGHPAARWKLSQWMLWGKFGPLEIFRGIVLSWRFLDDYVPATDGEPKAAGT
jgi:TPR repeat protein